MSVNRIERIFGELRRSGRKALMPFVCGGWPTVESTGAILPKLEAAGASIVEVGIPFSDPIADGPTIAAAMHRALEAGVTPEALIERVRTARAGVGLGLVAMVSVSIVGRFGAARFAGMLAGAGFDGVIYPDLPVEEAEVFTGPAREAGLTATLLVAPNTPAARAERIASASSGFVYLMTRVGITGEGAGPGLAWRIGRVYSPGVRRAPGAHGGRRIGPEEDRDDAAGSNGIRSNEHGRVRCRCRRICAACGAIPTMRAWSRVAMILRAGASGAPRVYVC